MKTFLQLESFVKLNQSYKRQLQKAFGQIHDMESADSIEQMVALLQNVVSSLPKNQSESVVVQECYPGFLEWNKHWSESFTHSKIKRPDLDCLQDVHLY